LRQALFSLIRGAFPCHGTRSHPKLIGGSRLRLWAIFERPGDPHVSPKLTHARPEELHHDSDAIKDAFRMLGLTWRSE
ncbi:hypothetical protein ACIQCU_09340, partial [Pseudarthrobacter oxydans]